MMIVGIDYSMTSPAVCCCPSPFDYSKCSFLFITSKKKLTIPGLFGSKIHGQLLQAYKNPPYEVTDYKDNLDRFTKLANMTVEWILEQPTAILMRNYVGLEGYAFGAKGQVFNIGENTGILKLKLQRVAPTVSVFAPSEIKKFATGKGNANKMLMYEAFVEETGDDLAMLFGIDPYNGESPVSDIIDSYYIAKYRDQNS